MQGQGLWEPATVKNTVSVCLYFEKSVDIQSCNHLDEMMIQGKHQLLNPRVYCSFLL